MDGILNSQRGAIAEPRLPPTPGRIFRVIAGLDEWTPHERAWLKQHPGSIAYQDQLQATLEDVHRQLNSQREVEEIVSVANGPLTEDIWSI